MLNNQSGLGGPSNTRNQFNQFTANQIQGGGNAFQLGGMPSGNVSGLQHALQGNYNLPQGMQGILQGGRAGVGGLPPAGSAQQPAGQNRFSNAQIPGGISQLPHGLGRTGMVGFPTMNGLNANPAVRGAVGGAGGAMNAALGGPGTLRPGAMDRGGLPPPGALGLGALGPGALQRGQGQTGGPQNLNLAPAGRSMGLGGPMGSGMPSGGLPASFNNALGIQTGSPRLHGAQLHGQHNPASKDLLAMIGKGAAAGGGGGGAGAPGAGSTAAFPGAGFGSVAISSAQAPGSIGHGNQQGQRGSSQEPADQLAFNPSDFPALGGGAVGGARGEAGRGGSQHLPSLPNGNATSSGLGGPPLSVGADLYASMQLHKGQEPFSMQQEEFPALPGSQPASSRAGDHGTPPASSQAPQTSSALSQLHQRQPQQQAPQQAQQALPSPFLRASALGPPFTGGSGSQPHEEGSRRSFADLPSTGMLPGLSGQSSRGGVGAPGGAGPSQEHQQHQQALLYAQQQQQQQRFPQQAPAKAQPALGGSNDAAPSSASLASGSSANQYGLLGLLTVISMSDPDVTTLALGTDLTTLGLHLNGVEPVYDTFASPWAEFPLKPDPDFKVPPYYRHKPPRLHLGYLTKFTQETLFYVFYSMPGDEAQILAADELSHRGWWFHKEHKVWLKRLAPGDIPHKAMAERPNTSSYLIFDPNTWELLRKDNIVVLLSDLERPPNLPRPSPPAGTNIVQSGHHTHPAHALAPHMPLS